MTTGVSMMAASSQTEFSYKKVSDSINFTYRWTDFAQSHQGVIIKVSEEEIPLYLNDPKMRLKPRDLDRWLYKQIANQAQAMSYGGYHIEAVEKDGIIHLDGSGIDKVELQSRIHLIEQTNVRALDYLENNTYFTLIDGSIRLNYEAIVIDSSPLLKPLAGQLGRVGASARDNINQFLPFLQTIPYDQLDGEDDFGLYTPMNMLVLNKGDCESKQIALATMLKAVNPGADIIFIGLVDHMIMGVRMPTVPGDQVFIHEGKPYVLMDATGPSMVPAGHISDREIERIKQGHGTIYKI